MQMNEPAHVQVVIQARMGATRLPGKILAPFGKRSVLAWVVERALAAKNIDRVVVATTISPLDDETEKLCIQNGYAYVRGSEDDVLGRFADAIQAYPADIIIRWTADNPLVDTNEMSRLVEILQTEQLDYVSNHKTGLPLGMGVEVFTSKAFERVCTEAKTPYDLEHVTPYFYQHPEIFKIRTVEPLEVYPFAKKIRLTLDTPEDQHFFTALVAGLNLSDPSSQPSTAEIISYLEAHPEVTELNSHVRQKTVPFSK